MIDLVWYNVFTSLFKLMASLVYTISKIVTFGVLCKRKPCFDTNDMLSIRGLRSHICNIQCDTKYDNCIKRSKICAYLRIAELDVTCGYCIKSLIWRSTILHYYKYHPP